MKGHVGKTDMSAKWCRHLSVDVNDVREMPWIKYQQFRKQGHVFKTVKYHISKMYMLVKCHVGVLPMLGKSHVDVMTMPVKSHVGVMSMTVKSHFGETGMSVMQCRWNVMFACCYVSKKSFLWNWYVVKTVWVKCSVSVNDVGEISQTKKKKKRDRYFSVKPCKTW